jgi:hypothetical protein
VDHVGRLHRRRDHNVREGYSLMFMAHSGQDYKLEDSGGTAPLVCNLFLFKRGRRLDDRALSLSLAAV